MALSPVFVPDTDTAPAPIVRTEVLAAFPVKVTVPVFTVSAVDIVALVTVAAFPEIFVWSPVLAPDTVVVPVTASVGVAEPERVTPFTVLGVIAPRDKVMAGVVVEVATVPDIPFAVVTDTDVTVPFVVAGAVFVMVAPAQDWWCDCKK